MRLLPFCLPWFLIAAVPLVAVGQILFRKRRRLPLYWDTLVVAPFFVWAIAFGGSHKSLSNGIVEPLMLGVVVGVMHAIYLAWPGDSRKRAFAHMLISGAVCSIAALGVAIWYPIIPE